MLQELNLSTTSDAAGEYGFRGVPIGEYNLRVNWKTEKGVKGKTVGINVNVPADAGAYDVELIG
jgi:hypothetical protein